MSPVKGVSSNITPGLVAQEPECPGSGESWAEHPSLGAPVRGPGGRVLIRHNAKYNVAETNNVGEKIEVALSGLDEGAVRSCEFHIEM